ncbi:hypothetical protein ACFVYD_16135 [Streptomyces sp. NPDC058301]|uniref:hypothetical protein n=1 Tax=Streptomyces sp. NPDC058301 TaxID=3346436 RepID=UPI0036E8F359
MLYAADSALGTVWRVPVTGGGRAAWATTKALRPVPSKTGFGANGIKVHDGAVWVSNTDRGTLLRIPVRRDGSAGRTRVRATGLDGIDDFAFTSRHADTVLAAVNGTNQVVVVRPRGTHSVVLTQQDGLSNPDLRGRTRTDARATHAAVPSRRERSQPLPRHRPGRMTGAAKSTSNSTSSRAPAPAKASSNDGYGPVWRDEGRSCDSGRSRSQTDGCFCYWNLADVFAVHKYAGTSLCWLSVKAGGLPDRAHGPVGRGQQLWCNASRAAGSWTSARSAGAGLSNLLRSVSPDSCPRTTPLVRPQPRG